MQFQSYAYGKNHWDLDPDLDIILKCYWPEFEQHRADLERFGEIAGGRAYALADYIDRTAQPELIAHNLDGQRVDRARLDPAHLELLKEIAYINRPPYEGGSWHHHFAYGYLLADTGLYCSLIVTNQTAYAIYKYMPEHHHLLEPLLSGEAWGATWMSETHAGSDLGANRTQARQDGDEWLLDGDDKYFASNGGLADYAIVTARPQSAPPGPKGIALFLVPRLREDGQLNFHVRRLKRKSATRAVPTGEVEFKNSRAFLVGEPQLGIYYTLENLTVSRLANAAGAVGLARKAHLEALYRVQARHAFGSALIEHSLVRSDMLDLAVRIAGSLALTFHAIHAFDRSWIARPPYDLDYHYARFLSHLAKNRTAEHASAATQLVMELFGGAGFMEDFAIARLHRESLVTLIWEGASNIQALDMLEAMHKKKAHQPFQEEFEPLLEITSTPASRLALHELQRTLAELGSLPPEQAQWIGKDALRTLADIAQVALLYQLAESGGERYAQLAELYARRFLAHEHYPAWAFEAQHLWLPSLQS